MGEHVVGGGDKFSHGGDDGDLGQFAWFAQSFVEGSDGWVAANGDDRCHAEAAPRRYPATGDVCLPARHSTVAVHERDTNESGDLLVASEPELGELGHQRRGGSGPHAGDGREQFSATSERRIGLDGIGKRLVDGGDLLGQEGQVDLPRKSGEFP